MHVSETACRAATPHRKLTSSPPIRVGSMFLSLRRRRPPLRFERPGASTNHHDYEVDLAGNVRGLRASGGASLGGYRYAAYRKTVEDTAVINQPLRWKARWFSPVAGGRYDVRARQWSPELGVCLTVDVFSTVGEASKPFDRLRRFRPATNRPSHRVQAIGLGSQSSPERLRLPRRW
jgi:hypothetical protein